MNEITFQSEAQIERYLKANDYGLSRHQAARVASYIWTHAMTPDHGKTVTVEIDRQRYHWDTLDEMVAVGRDL